MKRSSKITAMFAAMVMAATAVPAAAFAQDAQAVTAEVEVPGAKKDISGFEYSISGGEDQIYRGEKVEPVLSIWEDVYSDDLYEGQDYTVTYKNNKKIGTGKMIVKGIGEYTGTKTIKFNIVPANPGYLEVKSKNNKITLSWSKESQATKYRIFYSVNGSDYKKLADTSKCTYSTTKLDTKNTTYQFYVCSITKVKNKSYINNKRYQENHAVLQQGSIQELNNVKLIAKRSGDKISSITITGFDFESYVKNVKGDKPWEIRIGLCPNESFWYMDSIDITINSKKIVSCCYQDMRMNFNYDLKEKKLEIDVSDSKFYNSDKYGSIGLNGNFKSMFIEILKPKKNDKSGEKYETVLKVGNFIPTGVNTGVGYGGYAEMTFEWPEKPEQ